MKNYATLLRLTILNRLSALRPSSYRRDDGKLDKGQVIQAIALLICTCMLLGFVIVIEVALYKGLAMFNHAELLPAMALLMGTLGTLLMSFFYVMSSLYFGKDAVWMSFLPVRSGTVLAAKLTEIWAGEAVINLGLLMPAFIMYGMHIHADALYYVRAVLIALASPMVPIAIIAVLSTLLARLVGRLNQSAALTSLLSIGFVGLIVFAELTLLPKLPDDIDLAWLMKMLLGREALLQMMTSVFPPVLWGVKGLTGDWAQLALFVAVAVGSLALVIALLGKPYLGLCVRQTEQGVGRKKIRMGADSWRASSPLKALYGLELQDIFRSSVNLTQCLAGTIVFPLMMGVMLLGGSLSEDLSVIRTALDEMVAEIGTSPDMMLIIAAILGFVTFISPAAPTAITREGTRHAMNRALPVSPRLMLQAKLLVSLTIDAIALAVTLAVIEFALKLPMQTILPAVALVAAMRYGANAVQLTIDAIHPNLHWKTETQAVKQNVNVMFGMLVCIVLLALPITAAVLLIIWEQAAWTRLAAVIGIVALEAIIGFVLLHTVAEKRYAALEP